MAIICEMLMSEPLEPHCDMTSGALFDGSESMQISPARWRSEPSSPVSLASSVSSIEQPGCAWSRFSRYERMIESHSS